MTDFIDSRQVSNNVIANIPDMLTWYSDKDITILLSTDPDIQVLNANKYLYSDEYNKKAKKWPFRLRQTLFVQIQDRQYKNSCTLPDYEGIGIKTYSFKIMQDYRYDGATIVRLFWRLIGAPSDPRFLVGALLHDVLCQHHEYVSNDRKLATTVFERCLKASNTGWLTRISVYWTVDIYQNLFRHW